ncbi:hypothetical protein [Pseudomonas sp. LD120]|uniref:hypothetical protein n=1 Tax=Pseudomonas sp. LD120 TaxID=485751 RepID=UPI001357060B|nr:hypothetical protein [Pseudomonas sp. LD120]KAF0862308.1 hypothetical protein PLD_16550 [Pseudomonas sp. LD120]
MDDDKGVNQLFVHCLLHAVYPVQLGGGEGPIECFQLAPMFRLAHLFLPREDDSRESHAAHLQQNVVMTTWICRQDDRTPALQAGQRILD